MCAPEKIVDLVKGEMVKNEQNGEDKDHAEDLPINVTVIDEKKQQSTTQKSLAIAAVKDKRVFHVPEAGSFVVKGSDGDNYSVSLFPEKCQCPSVGSCYHIMAVKMSIGEENIEENRIYNLAQLRRNNRKRVKKKSRYQKAKTMRRRCYSHCSSRFLHEKKRKMVRGYFTFAYGRFHASL